MLIDRYLKFQDETFYHHGNWFIAFFSVLVALGGILLWYLSTHLLPYGNTSVPKAATERASANQASSGLFICKDGKSISAEFLGSEARLDLSDGRRITLPQAGSAALRRYANSDGSFVFLSNRNSAFLTENGIVTYASCNAKTE